MHEKYVLFCINILDIDCKKVIAMNILHYCIVLTIPKRPNHAIKYYYNNEGFLRHHYDIVIICPQITQIVC